ASRSESRSVDAKFACVMLDVTNRGDRVIYGRRKFVLGREAIVDRDHCAASAVRQLAAERIVAVEIAEHPPATMEIDQCRQQVVGPTASRTIRANAQRTTWARYRPVFRLSDFFRPRNERYTRPPELLARLLDAELVRWHEIHAGHGIDQSLNL